jgi:hypothetical protein
LRLPNSWHSTLKKLSGFFLGLCGKHLSSCKDSRDGRNTLMNKCKNFFCCQDFHVNECFYWVSGIKLSLAYLNLFKHLLLVELVPHLNDRWKTSCPFSLVKSKLLSSDCS